MCNFNLQIVYKFNKKVRFHPVLDPDARRLEHGALQWNVADYSVGRALLRRTDDFRQLCSLQSPSRYSGRRLPREQGGGEASPGWF